MKAAVYLGNKTIKVQEKEIRELAPDEVLVQIKACGVCGTDLHIYEGAKGAADCTPPVILGHEMAGIVHQVGSGVKIRKPGDRVCVDPNDFCGECIYCRKGMVHFCTSMRGTGTTTDGGFAEYCIVPERQLYLIDDQLSFEEGAMAEPVACCLNGIDKSHIKTGDTVAIIGGGTIGQLMLRLAKLAGASSLIMIEPVESKRDLALRSGAALAVDPKNECVEEAITKAGFSQIDVVIECVGLKNTMEQAMDIAGKGATVMLFGLTHPDCELSYKPFAAFQKELTVTTSFINPFTQPRAAALLNSGMLQVKDLITDRIPLDKINQVFEDQSYRSHGKIVIQP